MPCSPRKARLLLKEGKAKVIKMVPFTLQLLYGSSGYKQEVSLGVDAGTQYIGVSATTEKAVLFEAEVLPRTDIQQLLATRSQFRRARRSRKTRYRTCRFRNRKKPAGWLAPSVQHKVEAHLKTIRLVHSILPVHHTTLEVAQFDIQKIRHPEMEGKESFTSRFFIKPPPEAHADWTSCFSFWEPMALLATVPGRSGQA